MNFKCTECGTLLKVSPETTSPVVACPRCQRRYRLKPAPAKTGGAPPTSPVHLAPTGAVQPSPPPAAPTAPPTPPAIPAPTPAAPAPTPPVAPTPAAALNPPAAPAPTPPAAPAVQGPSTTPAARPVTAPPRAATPHSGTPYGTAPGTSTGSSFQPGEVLAARYRIDRFLARGGMGEVYEAFDQELLETVALKTIRVHGMDEASALDRFKREISLARKVTHPNVCRIFDLGQHRTDAASAPLTFLTMELLAGETLTAFLRRRGRLAVQEALPLARQVAGALDAAHKAQIVHRDLKSENIFLVREDAGIRAVVTDFGIARGGHGDQFAARVTGVDIVGTPAYMAPEQVENQPVTAAADIYAFGVVLYEMVTGRLPFESDNPLTTAAKRLQEKPPPPHIHVPDIDVRWEKVILRCLERYPDKRFASAGEAVQGLDKAPVRRPPPGTAPRPVAARPQTIPPRAAPSPTGSKPVTAPPTPRPAAVPLHSTSTTLSPWGEQGGKTRSQSAVARAGSSSSTRPLVFILIAVAVVSAVLFAWNRSRDPQRAPRPAVAVMGIANQSAQEKDQWLETALAEMIGTELARGSGVRTVSGDELARVRRELGIDGAGELTQDQMRRMHTLLGCDFVITGSFVTIADRMQITLRVANAAVGTALEPITRDGGDAELFDLVRGLGSDVRGKIGVGSDGAPDNALAGLPRDRAAARLYSEALDALRRSEPKAARETLGEAVRIEPENPLIRSALATALQALGYEQRAAEEAERAFELSSTLPQEDRWVIEGQYRETQGDWAAAIQVYHQLYDFFPDNLDYGLRLVAAYTKTRQLEAALGVVDRLRDLPAPVSEDPRIDLADAEIAAQVADYARQHETAQRAAERAESMGATLLAARARITESQANRFLGRSQPSIQAAQSAHDFYRQVDHPIGVGLALVTLANAHFDLGELDRARDRAQEAVTIYRKIGDQGGLASALNTLATVYKSRGDLKRAGSLYQESEEIHEQTGNRLGMANTLNNRATILIIHDELTAARGKLERARKIWQEAGDRSGVAFVLNNLAAVRRLEGDLAASRRLNDEALEIRRALEQKMGEVFSLVNLGGTLADLGEIAAAEDTLGQGLTLADAMGHRAARAYCLFELAELRLAQGDLAEAERLHGEALDLREEIEDKRGVADSHAALARVDLAAGKPGPGEVVARRAIDGFNDDARRAEEGRATAFLALALLDQSLETEARRMADEARRLGEKSEQIKIRYWIEYADARVADAEGITSDALRILGDLEEEMKAAGFLALAYEAAITAAEIELVAVGSAAAEARLAEIQEEASLTGLRRIQAMAAVILTEHGI